MNILVTGGCGHVGSALSNHLVKDGHTVWSIDWQDRGCAGDAQQRKANYRKIARMYVENYDVVIHLAGHSSVKACDADPWGSADNNVSGFIGFLKTLSDLPKPPLLLWASSGSVRSDVHALYDEQKRALECLVPQLYPRSIGLRFASVCGVSPNTRDDIILNAMVRSAVFDGVINLANPKISKPILGLKDLCAGVSQLFDILSDLRGGRAGFMVNMASFACTPEEAAQAVMEATGAVIRRQPDSSAYDFEMFSDVRARQNIGEIVAELAGHYGKQKAVAA